MHPGPLKTDSLPGRTLETSQGEYIFCSGTSYLGMAANEEFLNNLQEGLQQYGSNYSSSRLSNVQLRVFEEAEEYLANFTNTEAALTVSSGFMAGQLVVRALAESGNFYYGPRTHPALWLTPANFSDEDFDNWANQIPAKISVSSAPKNIILFNSLDPLWAQKYGVNWLDSLPTDKNIILVIDDSHGFGVTGADGAGISSYLNVPASVEVIIVSSLGKAIGIPGGVISGSKSRIESLKHHPFFGGASPTIPAYLYAFLKSEKIYNTARQKLFNNITYFKSYLNHPELFRCFQDYPVFYTPQPDLYNYLLQKGILISSFSYPSPTSPPITRLILNSLHTKSDLDLILSSLNKYPL